MNIYPTSTGTSTSSGSDLPQPSASISAPRRPPSVVVETLGATTSEIKEDLRKINSYLLKKEIGRGIGLGVDRETVAAAATAVMTPGSSNPLDHVRGEMAILKKLDHTNVVKLFEVLDDPNGDSIYMVFEMAHKGVLMDIFMNETSIAYSEGQAPHYFEGMILGIEYLHNNDIAYRDIKPDNLLLSNDDVLKIVDSGVSEIFIKVNDKLKKSAGNPAFIAPVSCKSYHGEVSGKAPVFDLRMWHYIVWSLAIYLTQAPIYSNYWTRLMMILGFGDEDRDISVELHDLLQKLLDKDPFTRITMHDYDNT
ncbi:kinase-like domain-containing protein [Absidia repens]|uniref:Kinase-like domain-containing protein n=1 Tax=Absidia repens TaxID=90262 RepID=A0A1X2I4C3_9FUNG|nr:kinase-like domain-containing protein [Absidia repens]